MTEGSTAVQTALWIRRTLGSHDNELAGPCRTTICVENVQGALTMQSISWTARTQNSAGLPADLWLPAEPSLACPKHNSLPFQLTSLPLSPPSLQPNPDQPSSPSWQPTSLAPKAPPNTKKLRSPAPPWKIRGGLGSESARIVTPPEK